MIISAQFDDQSVLRLKCLFISLRFRS